MAFYFHDISNGEVYELEDGMTLGRKDESDIVIKDDKISSKHLKIDVNPQFASITDLNTSNGTELNGETIPPGVIPMLNIKDIVKVGRIELLYSDEKNLDVDKNTSLKRSIKASGSVKQRRSNNSEVMYDNLREFTMDSNIANNSKLVSFEKAVIKDTGDIFSREEDCRKIIRNHKIKIRKLYRSVEKLTDKISEKNELLNKVSDIENKYSGQDEKLDELKENYEKYKDEWQSWNVKLKKLKREIAKLEEKKSKIAPGMEKYEEYLEDMKNKNTMLVDVKRLSRENLNDKKFQLENEIKSEEQGIKEQESNIVQLGEEKKEQERQRRKNIIAEIKRLQAELDDAG